MINQRNVAKTQIHMHTDAFENNWKLINKPCVPLNELELAQIFLFACLFVAFIFTLLPIHSTTVLRLKYAFVIFSYWFPLFHSLQSGGKR